MSKEYEESMERARKEAFAETADWKTILHPQTEHIPDDTMLTVVTSHGINPILFLYMRDLRKLIALQDKA